MCRKWLLSIQDFLSQFVLNKLGAFFLPSGSSFSISNFSCLCPLSFHVPWQAALQGPCEPDPSLVTHTKNQFCDIWGGGSCFYNKEEMENADSEKRCKAKIWQQCSVSHRRGEAATSAARISIRNAYIHHVPDAGESQMSDSWAYPLLAPQCCRLLVAVCFRLS